MKSEREKKNHEKTSKTLLIVIAAAALVFLIIIMFLYSQPQAVNSNQASSSNISTVQVNQSNQSQVQPVQSPASSNSSTVSNASNQTPTSKTVSGFCYDGTPVGECNSQGQYCTINHVFVYDCNGNPSLGYPACGCGSGLKCVTSGPYSGECLPS